MWDCDENEAMRGEYEMLTAASLDLGKEFIVPVVYAFYASDGTCLYVGSSCWLEDRIDWHRRKEYWETVSKIGIKMYLSREEMRIAEMIDLVEKKPELNRDGVYRDNCKALYFGDSNLEYRDYTTEFYYTREEMMNRYGFQRRFPHVPGWRAKEKERDEERAGGAAAQGAPEGAEP